MQMSLPFEQCCTPTNNSDFVSLEKAVRHWVTNTFQQVGEFTSSESTGEGELYVKCTDLKSAIQWVHPTSSQDTEDFHDLRKFPCADSQSIPT